MSHFTVLVIGNDPEGQLAPFDENDRKPQDATEKYQHEYETEKVRTARNVATGKHYLLIDKQFYRPPTPEEKKAIEGDNGFIASSGTVKMPDGSFIRYEERRWDGDDSPRSIRVHSLPEGFVEDKATLDKVYNSLADCMKDWHGFSHIASDADYDPEDNYVQTDKYGNVVRIVEYVPDNPKWDWYALGGRWNDMLKLKTPSDYDGDACCNSAFKYQIDFDGMIAEAEDEAAATWDAAQDVINAYRDKPFMPFSEFQSKYKDWQDARTAYNKQPLVKAFSDSDASGNLDELMSTSREDYIDRYRYNNITTFAVLVNGEWYERGTMGWWGIVSDEKPKEDWDKTVWRLIQEADDTDLMSVYDCHI